MLSNLDSILLHDTAIRVKLLTLSVAGCMDLFVQAVVICYLQSAAQHSTAQRSAAQRSTALATADS